MAAQSKPDLGYSKLDISSEQYREYAYPNGKAFRIDNPKDLYILTDTGSHRVVDTSGVTHRPERGYVGISWKPTSGAPPFIA